MILKGQEIKLKLDGKVIAKSQNCTLNITANTSDESSKDDADPYFDHPSVESTGWSAQNESFIADTGALKEILTKFKAKQPMPVEVSDPAGVTTAQGYALITGITVDAPNNGKATLSISLTGNGILN